MRRTCSTWKSHIPYLLPNNQLQPVFCEKPLVAEACYLPRRVISNPVGPDEFPAAGPDKPHARDLVRLPSFRVCGETTLASREPREEFRVGVGGRPT